MAGIYLLNDQAPQEEKESEFQGPTLPVMLLLLTQCEPKYDAVTIPYQGFLRLLMATKSTAQLEPSLKQHIEKVFFMIRTCKDPEIKQKALWEALINSGSVLGAMFKNGGFFSVSFGDVIKELGKCVNDKIVMAEETKAALEGNEELQKAIWKKAPQVYKKLEYYADVKDFENVNPLAKKEMPRKVESSAKWLTLGGDGL